MRCRCYPAEDWNPCVIPEYLRQTINHSRVANRPQLQTCSRYALSLEVISNSRLTSNSFSGVTFNMSRLCCLAILPKAKKYHKNHTDCSRELAARMATERKLRGGNSYPWTTNHKRRYLIEFASKECKFRYPLAGQGEVKYLRCDRVLKPIFQEVNIVV